MAFRIQTASVNLLETRISYFEVGSGQPVLMLHGNPGSKNDFKQLAEGFASSEIRLVVPDRPGHGNSEELIPETPDPWFDAQAYSEIIKKTCSGKAYLVGYSLGAFLALKVAIKYPDMVCGLGLIAPFVAPNDPSETPSALPDWAKNRLLGTALGLLMPSLAGSRMRKHLADVWLPATIPEAILDEELKHYTNFELLLSTMRDKNDMLRIFKDLHPKLPEIKCPALVILGGKDAICDTNAQWEILGKSLSRVQRADIPEGGHGLPFTHCKEVGELLVPHIKSTK